MPSNHLIFSHPLPSCPQSFPASGSFSMSQFFPSGGQRIGASASAPALPMNIQDRFPLQLTGLISLQSKGKPGVLEKGKSWRRERLPTPVFWPGEFHGVYSPWGRKELDTTEWLSLLTCRPVLFKLWLFFPNPLQWVLFIMYRKNKLLQKLNTKTSLFYYYIQQL